MYMPQEAEVHVLTAGTVHVDAVVIERQLRQYLIARPF